MKEISIICASPPLYNPGMHSVDFAFYRLIKKYRIEGNFTFYCYPNIDSDTNRLSCIPFKYHDTYENLNQIIKSDIIIFWGDFLHNRIYFDELLTRIKPIFPKRSIEDLYNVIYKIFLFENIDLKKTKIIIFGGNLMSLNSIDDFRYESNLINLYKKASLILMRDVESAMKVNQITRNYEENYCGVDCAFIQNNRIQTFEKYNKNEIAKKEFKIGIFFGRSWYYEACYDFCLKLCNNLNIMGTWFPWFHDKPWPLVEKYSDHFDLSIKDLDFNATIEKLKEFSLVITDTYHLCINSWALGIPAVCIGRGVGNMKYSTDDKKKEVLYKMIGAENLYVFAEDILKYFYNLKLAFSYLDENELIELICNTLNSDTKMKRIYENISNTSINTEKRLIEVLLD